MRHFRSETIFNKNRNTKTIKESKTSLWTFLEKPLRKRPILQNVYVKNVRDNKTFYKTLKQFLAKGLSSNKLMLVVKTITLSEVTPEFASLMNKYLTKLWNN